MKTNNSKSIMIFNAGRVKIEVRPNGSIFCGRTARGQILDSSHAVEWLATNGKTAKFNAWLAERDAIIKKWLEDTPHHVFDCDGGSLAVRVNGGGVVRIGCGGDGAHCLYVVRDIPEFWTSTGISFDDCTLEPLDYDCGDGKPLENITAQSVWVFRFDDNIALVIHND